MCQERDWSIMKKRISIDLIEEHQAKLEALTKKSYMSSTDYQRAIINLIDKAYESKK